MTAKPAALGAVNFPFLDRIGEDARRELVRLRPTRARPRQQLLRPGDDAAGAYLVTAGALRVYYITAAGREATLYEVAPGSTCILAVTSSFNDEPYPAWVQAAARGASFVRVESAVLKRLFHAEPAFREFIFRVMSDRIFELMRTLEETGTASMEARVANYLARHADASGVVAASQQSIAAELGTAREVVFRALRSLASKGLVQTGRMRVRALDTSGLRLLGRRK